MSRPPVRKFENAKQKTALKSLLNFQQILFLLSMCPQILVAPMCCVNLCMKRLSSIYCTQVRRYSPSSIIKIEARNSKKNIEQN